MDLVKTVELDPIKTIIFDLDDTLCDSVPLIAAQYQKVKKALNFLDTKYLKFLNDTFKENSFEYSINTLIDLIKKDKIPEKDILISKILSTKEAYYIKDDNFNIALLIGTKEALETLYKNDFSLFLVTIGDPIMQMNKIKKLGIGKFFKIIFITNQITGESTLKDSELEKFESRITIKIGVNKGFFFKDILVKFNLRPKNTMIVGDKLKDELKYGHELGFLTVQMLHGKYKDAKADFEPHYKISSLSELLELLKIK